MELEIVKTETKKLPAFSWIVQKLCSDLAESDRRDGYIYAFKAINPEAQNYVKIGVSNNVEIRLGTHKKCYDECELMYPRKGKLAVKVKHARRVEQLVHAELVEQGMLLSQCPMDREHHKSHGEWFDVDEQYATDFIQRWSDFMNSSPYRETTFIEKPQIRSPFRKSASGEILKTLSANREAPEPLAVKRWQLQVLEGGVKLALC
jgi:T5orf172 domain